MGFLLLSNRTLKRPVRISFRSNLILQLANLSKVLRSEQLVLVTLLLSPTEVVLHLRELVLHVLFLTEHTLELSLVVFLLLSRHLQVLHLLKLSCQLVALNR